MQYYIREVNKDLAITLVKLPPFFSIDQSPFLALAGIHLIDWEVSLQKVQDFFVALHFLEFFNVDQLHFPRLDSVNEGLNPFDLQVFAAELFGITFGLSFYLHEDLLLLFLSPPKIRDQNGLLNDFSDGNEALRIGLHQCFEPMILVDVGIGENKLDNIKDRLEMLMHGTEGGLTSSPPPFPFLLHDQQQQITISAPASLIFAINAIAQQKQSIKVLLPPLDEIIVSWFEFIGLPSFPISFCKSFLAGVRSLLRSSSFCFLSVLHHPPKLILCQGSLSAIFKSIIAFSGIAEIDQSLFFQEIYSSKDFDHILLWMLLSVACTNA